MFSDKCGVKKTILKVKSDDLISMYKDSEVGNIVSEIIIGYVRALENSRGSNILTLYQLVNNQVEALEFYAKGENYFYNKALKDVKIKKNCLIACIIRNNEVIIPSGVTQILQGDNVVVTTHKNFDDLTDVFE